jgi:homoserine dehydrogenase
MEYFPLVLVGFGNVGKALAQLLLDKKEEINSRYAVDYAVTGIFTGSHGAVVDVTGIDVQKALNAERLEDIQGVKPAGSIDEFIALSGARVLFESIPVNYQDGQPAVDILSQALKKGLHAISANKGPVVHAFDELNALAEAGRVRYFFESAVMDGAPVFGVFRETLPGLNLLSFEGVLNSTTNVILTRMERGDSFDDAVRYTQQIGLAESDPSGDIDGWDAAVKVAALCMVLMGVKLTPQQVLRKGIRSISGDDIRRARSEGKRWKLVCRAQKLGQTVSAVVKPEMVPPTSPFFSVEDSTSIVCFRTDILEELCLVEGNPGPRTTAYGMMADFLNAVR